MTNRQIAFEQNGRYTEIYVDGVQDGSIAIDWGIDDDATPSLIVSEDAETSYSIELSPDWAADHE